MRLIMFLVYPLTVWPLKSIISRFISLKRSQPEGAEGPTGPNHYHLIYEIYVLPYNIIITLPITPFPESKLDNFLCTNRMTSRNDPQHKPRIWGQINMAPKHSTAATNGKATNLLEEMLNLQPSIAYWRLVQAESKCQAHGKCSINNAYDYCCSHSGMISSFLATSYLIFISHRLQGCTFTVAHFWSQQCCSVWRAVNPEYSAVTPR